MDVAIHWQNADSSSAKAVREIFPKDVVHPGRAHRKNLEKRQILPLKHVEMISPSYLKRSIRVVRVDVRHLYIQSTHQFYLSQDEFVRRVRNNHWCVVSTVCCETGAYDSLYKPISKSA